MQPLPILSLALADLAHKHIDCSTLEFFNLCCWILSQEKFDRVLDLK